MDSYIGLDNFWDLSNNPNTFSSIGEDDFLALLQKQFPTATANPFELPPPDGIDPININGLPVQDPTPPSTDSSPSPPSMSQEPSANRRDSGAFGGSTSPVGSDIDDPTLKRKASDEDMTDEPTLKNVHTDSIAGRKPSSGPHRRKSTGNPHQDELRLLKRKEQNRAAQRAFRERKEKHVKDLEDKVAALEAKHQAAENENDNLRDLLSRLQSENMALKQAAFTFSVPKGNTSGAAPFPSTTPTSFFSSPGASTSSAVPSPPHQPGQTQQQPQQFEFNFGSLIPFDPASLNMLDEPTATDGAMNMDFGLGQPNGLSPYKTIASNPMYMSFAEPTPYDLTPPPVHPIMQMQSPPVSTNGDSVTSPIDQALRMTPFDWNANSPPTSTATNSNSMDTTMDHLYNVGFNGAQSPVDFSALLRSPPSSVSPVSHRSGSSPLSASSPTTTVSVAPSPLSNPPTNGFASHPPGQSTDQCPRTKEELSKMIEARGPSSFVQDPPPAMRTNGFFANGGINGNGAATAASPDAADGEACPRITKEALVASMHSQASSPASGADDTVGPNGGFVRKMNDGNGSVVMCKGSSFPKTEKNERNIEVLTAWRSITQNPQFKNVDINELCSEFTKKARCDGTKVVLEPEGVNAIILSLAKRSQT